MIKILNLTVKYGNKPVLNNVNIDFENGKIHGIVGLNGAGKTTFFNVLAKILKPETGQIRLNNIDLSIRDTGILETVNFFYSGITGNEYLKIFRQTNSGFNLSDLQIYFSLPLDELVENYSTGMKKKLALLAVLKQNKPIFILDEPFNGLDLETNKVLEIIIMALKQKDKTIFVSSHIIEPLLAICDNIHLLENGSFIKTFEKTDFGKIENELFGKLKYEAKQIISKAIWQQNEGVYNVLNAGNTALWIKQSERKKEPGAIKFKLHLKLWIKQKNYLYKAIGAQQIKVINFPSVQKLLTVAHNHVTLKTSTMVYKTSLDKLAKSITIITTVCFILFIIVQFHFAGKIIATFVAVFILLVYFISFAFRPIEYILTQDKLIIHRLFKNVHIYKDKIKSVELLDKEKMKGSIRTFGVGGLFGYFGKFYNNKIGSMTWYATRRDRMILIKTDKNENIILTPNDPDQFLSDISL